MRSIGKYLAHWGFTPPIKCAYEQSPEAVQNWLQREYPAIEQRARAEGAEVHGGDATALVNTDVRGRSDAPAGKTPVAMVIGGSRQKLSMIASATNQGKTRWMVIDDAFDAHKLIEFLQALIKDAGKHVPVRTKVKLCDAANEHMTMLEQCPERVIGYFQDRRVRLAAWFFIGPDE